MSYYRNFRLVIGSPLWRLYLRWAYRKCIDDFKYLDFIPDFKNKTFTCLLCGVGNEVTADEFIKFALLKNKKAKIIIIDLGKEQIQAVRKLIQKKHSTINIKVKQMNALDLDKMLKDNSIDWIETDGFLEFFDKDSLYRLLTIWDKLLKPKGFITLREPASRGTIGHIIDKLRVWAAKIWLGITIYRYDQDKLTSLFNKTGFEYVEHSTFIPTFDRFSLITSKHLRSELDSPNDSYKIYKKRGVRK